MNHPKTNRRTCKPLKSSSNSKSKGLSVKYSSKNNENPNEILKKTSILMSQQSPLKYLKKSMMYSLSGILHRWCKKELVLNLFNNTLLIRKKGKENLLYLSQCSVKNMGKFKKKWCFSLESSSSDEKSKKSKKYIIGCDEKAALDEWIVLLTEELNVLLKYFNFCIKVVLYRRKAWKLRCKRLKSI